MKKTKIEKIETILWNRWLLIKIHCEDGTIGIGEGGVHGWQRPTKTMIETMEPYLIGKDPSLIEHGYIDLVILWALLSKVLFLLLISHFGT